MSTPAIERHQPNFTLIGLHPARMQRTPSDRSSWGGAPERGEAVWMATRVGDPPIVTFQGAVLRVDGPWHLELPLA